MTKITLLLVQSSCQARPFFLQEVLQKRVGEATKSRLISFLHTSKGFRIKLFFSPQPKQNVCVCVCRRERERERIY